MVAHSLPRWGYTVGYHKPPLRGENFSALSAVQKISLHMGEFLPMVAI